MTVMPYLTLLPLAAIAGVASHIFYFHRGEHHLFPMRVFQAFLLILLTALILFSQYGGLEFSQSLKATSAVAGSYLLGLFASLATYRLLFNRLNRFPGPYFNRLSKFFFAVRLAKLDAYLQLQKLHQDYGPYVRIGPNDLSVADPEAVEVLLGPKSKCMKAPWYDQDFPFISMHTSRGKTMHDRRRRIWSPAFSDKALRGYENRIQKYNDKLIQQIRAFSGKPINMSKWFNLYSFDVMGDLAFGKSYNMLESGEQHWSLKLLSEGMDPTGQMFPVWFFRFMLAVPGLAAGYHKFVSYCGNQMDERINMGKMEYSDISASLVDHYKQSSDPDAERLLLYADSRLIIVAGSDTTAATLTHLFYHLAFEPSLTQRLREELISLTSNGSKIDHQTIQDAHFLTGCINESLRLHPPVPSGVFRMTPPEGLQIGDTFIPGGTTMQPHNYTLGHDQNVYPNAESFIPERWYSKPELIRNREAFVPFSTGPFGCIGKNLAYMELRLLISQLVIIFDVALAEGEMGENLLWKSKDHFTVELGELNLVFKTRAS